MNNDDDNDDDDDEMDSYELETENEELGKVQNSLRFMFFMV